MDIHPSFSASSSYSSSTLGTLSSSVTPTSKSRSSTQWTKDESTTENTPYTANSILFNVPEDLTSRLFLDSGSEERSRAASDALSVNYNDTPQASPKRRGSGLITHQPAEYDFTTFLELNRNSPATPASDTPSPSSPAPDRKRDKDKEKDKDKDFNRRVSKAKSFSTLPIPQQLLEKVDTTSNELSQAPSQQGNVGQATAPPTNAGSPAPPLSEFLGTEESLSVYSHSPTDQKIKPRNVYIKYQFMLTQLLVDPHFEIATNLLLESILRGNDTDLISCMVNYLEKIGRITHFIKIAISQDIQQTTSANNLFRGESLAAKLVSNFFRKTGLKYLQQCVVDPTIADINHLSPSVSSELMQDQLLESLLIRLVSTVDKCPVSIRQLCQFTQSEISAKFGEEWYIVAKSLVFLRFICPSLVSPQTYSNSQSLSASNTNANDIVNTLVKLSKRVQTVVNNMDIAETHFSILTRAFISKLMAPVTDLSRSSTTFSDHMRCLLLDEMVSSYQLNSSNFEVSDQIAEDCLQYIIFCLKEYLPNLKSRLLSIPNIPSASQGTSGQQSPRALTRTEKQVKKEKTALFAKLQEVLLGLSVSYQAHKQSRLNSTSSRGSGLFGKGQSKSTQKQDVVLALETEREAKQYYHSLLMDLVDKMVESEETRQGIGKKKDGKKHRRSRSDVQQNSGSDSKRESLDDIRKQYSEVMTQLAELRQFKELKEHYTDIVKLVKDLTQHIQSGYQMAAQEASPLVPTQVHSPSKVTQSVQTVITNSNTPTNKANINLLAAAPLPFSTGSSPSRRPSLTDEDIARSYENYKDLLEAQTIDLKDQFEEIIRLDDPSDSSRDNCNRCTDVLGGSSMLSTRYWMEYAKEKEIQLKLSKRNTYKILLNSIKIEKENRKLQQDLSAANAKIDELTKTLSDNNNNNTNLRQSKSTPHSVKLHNNINIHFTTTDTAKESDQPLATTTEAEVGAERTNKNAKPKVVNPIQELNRATNNSNDNVLAQIAATINPPIVKEPLSGPATLDVDKVTQALLVWQQRPAPRKFATYSDSSDTDSDSDDEPQQVNSRINLSQRPLNVGARRSSVTFGSATIIQTQVVSKENSVQKHGQPDTALEVDDDELTQEDEDMKTRQFNVLEIVNDTDNEAEDTAPEDVADNDNVKVASKTKVTSSSSNEFLKLLDDEDYKHAKKKDHSQPLAKVPSITSTIPHDIERATTIQLPVKDLQKEEELAKPYFVSVKSAPIRPSSMNSLNYRPSRQVDAMQSSSVPTTPSNKEKATRAKSMKVQKGKCAVQ